MNILTFDTCLDKMYVALGNKSGHLSSKIVETTQTTYHSAFIISTITNILKEQGLTPEDINVIATNIGPGSFTGIRACTTVARVMAQGLNLKTVGVSSLEILARINAEQNPSPEFQELVPRSEILPSPARGEEQLQHFTLHPSPFTRRTLVALDARKEMAYVAVFEKPLTPNPSPARGEGIKTLKLAPQVILLEELKEMIKKEDYFIVTDDKLEPILGGVSYQKGDYDLGKYLVEIAAEKLKNDFNTDWKKLLPLYIQPPALHVKKQA